MSDHSLLSPSASSRWLNCPASLAACRAYPKATSSYAEEGTKAHEVGEALLKVRPLPCGIDDEMLAYCEAYADTVTSMAQGAIRTWTEQKIGLGDVYGVKDQKGTADHIAVVELPNGRLELQVHDLQYGKGVQGDAEANTQLIIYGLGALDMVNLVFDTVETVRLVIHQPRLSHVSEVVYSVDEMDDWRREIKDGAAFALQIYENAKAVEEIDIGCFNPGEKQCRFCPHKGDCKALAEQAMRNIVGDFENLDDVDLPPEIIAATESVRLSTSDRVAKLLPTIGLIKSWCQAVEDHAFSLLLQGETIPGYKLVEGRPGNRKWSDEALAEAAMKSMKLRLDQMYVQSIISPTAASKLLEKESPRKWKRLSELITRSEPKPALVEASDKRPALVINKVDEDFEDLTQEDSLV